ncbi:uncharacterized protein B0H18DRAFT_43612 [Fomitopsis serialis]|uniref:uncharacterized protein n=1 Tax=Fomitopsis serialis TaxID=139415 RepID=UPI00200848CB|nr:uncharacterized protein B0H18DRAFT_43612 [Neoantrodia serialis]KAH9917189.1 hypothetical protein B0H18DRAFT_43612 [Neoantrodia serialis]
MYARAFRTSSLPTCTPASTTSAPTSLLLTSALVTMLSDCRALRADRPRQLPHLLRPSHTTSCSTRFEGRIMTKTFEIYSELSDHRAVKSLHTTVTLRPRHDPLQLADQFGRGLMELD